METKMPLKLLTLSLFVILIFGLVLYKGGYIFSGEKKSVVTAKEKTEEIKAVADGNNELNVFQHLKSAGGFTPKNFDTLFVEPVFYDTRFLASSKSIVMADFHFDRYGQSTTYLSLVVRAQLKSTQIPKKK